MWYAAYDVYPGRRFKDYAILGDDIVIADPKVAERYREIMEEVGGIISVDKSLISHNGACEFAKRFIVDNHRDRTDCSPVSVACLLLAFSSVSISAIVSLGCPFMSSFRLRGGGYRVLSKVRRREPAKVFSRLSLRWKRHWLSLFTPSGLSPLPLDLWLAFPEKAVLSCYEVGKVREFLLEVVKPRDLDEESFSILDHFWEDDVHLMEERLISSVVRSHLRYLKCARLSLTSRCLVMLSRGPQ